MDITDWLSSPLPPVKETGSLSDIGSALTSKRYREGRTEARESIYVDLPRIQCRVMTPEETEIMWARYWAGGKK